MEKTNSGISSKVKILAVSNEDESRRLDLFVSEKGDITRSQAQRLIREGLVLVNSKAENPNYKIRPADTVEMKVEETSGELLIPEAIPLNILFMDEYLAVADKPAGMVVYPAAGHNSGTMMNALAYCAPKLATIGGGLRPGVVHRLDKDTSGVMVVALDDAAYYNLVEQFSSRTIKRKYLAIVSGVLKDEEGEISLAIGRSDSDRKKMSTKSRRGKEALTRWKVIRRLNKATLIEARLGTGRTHQIRVHFSATGHSVLGDETYGKKTYVEIRGRKILVPRQMLHAETLGFVHPHTGKQMKFSSPMPDDMKECIAKLAP
jgi:23S rRNA pseudouridine1911/1915/1917 synthase